MTDAEAFDTAVGELWLMRHGDTAWSAVGRHTGRNDLPLSADGEEQARTLGERLDGTAFDRVVCSPLLRARQTCALAGYSDHAVIDADAVEWDYGAYEGRTTSEIRVDRPGWWIWRDGVIEGETLADLGSRADAVLARVLPVAEGGGRVAIFAHGHFLRVFAARWIQEPPILGARLHLDPARISLLGYKHGARVITKWNS